jgi:hypothetical protein
MRHLALPLCLSAASLLAGCEMLGIESTAQIAERKQAEAHAIGSACRHAIRSVEDCFKTNPKAGKAAVFAGWKEMDQYMRDNQIVGMPSPAVTEAPTDAGSADGEEAPATEHAEEAPKKSPATKGSAKPAADNTAHEVKTHKS